MRGWNHFSVFLEIEWDKNILVIRCHHLTQGRKPQHLNNNLNYSLDVENILILYEIWSKQGKKNNFVNHDETQPIDHMHIFVDFLNYLFRLWITEVCGKCLWYVVLVFCIFVQNVFWTFCTGWHMKPLSEVHDLMCNLFCSKYLQTIANCVVVQTMFLWHGWCIITCKICELPLFKRMGVTDFALTTMAVMISEQGGLIAFVLILTESNDLLFWEND